MKWTYDICRSLALRYTIKRDFNEAHPKAYESARYHGWLKDYSWLRDGRGSGITRTKGYQYHSHPKYSNEQIIEAAKKYTKKVDFLHNDKALYHAALNRGLMPQFTWLQSSAHLFDSVNFVYRYYFKDENAVYVGRTIDPQKRDYEHHRDRRKESSSVLKFAQERAIEIPPMEILAENLSGEDSQRVEDEYVRKYQEEGMYVLNKGATGIGIGSMGMRKRQTRKRFFSIARQYDTVSDFVKEQHALYIAGVKNGWIHECDFLKRKIRNSQSLTKEHCIEIAKECSSRTSLAHRDPTVYQKMLREGWLDDCEWLVSAHKNRRVLTHDFCIELARRYSSLTDLRREQSPIAKKLYKTGWIDECTWFPCRKTTPVSKFSKEGKLLGTFSSINEAAQSVQSPFQNIAKNIKKACRGKVDSAYGFVWRFAEDKGDISHEA